MPVPPQIPWRDQQGRLAALVEEAHAWRTLAQTLHRDISEVLERAAIAQANAHRPGQSHLYAQALEHVTLDLQVNLAVHWPQAARIELEADHLRRTFRANERNREYMAKLKGRPIAPSQSQLWTRQERPQGDLTPAQQRKVDAIRAQGIQWEPGEEEEANRLAAELRKGVTQPIAHIGTTDADREMLARYNAKQRGKDAQIFDIPFTEDADPNAPLIGGEVVEEPIK